MTHQAEIEKRKYRNWVRGGLAYKYLKQGLEGFADDVVKQEHRRILAAVNHTPGTSCNLCCLINLQPIHSCKRDYDGKKMCPYGVFKCNCLHGKTQRCPSNICDGIMEEILKSHGSSPPQPYWQNTDIQKWCKLPWEVAKCFINAPGYSDKTKAADIDISGLLHVFINNTNLHSHLACSMAGKNVFVKVRERRNKLFHSATMEIEEGEMFECIDDIVEILEDPKQLKGRPEVQQAVNKLKQLKNSDFLITTHNEIEVCREALAYVSMKSKELEQTIQDAKNSVSDVQKDNVEELQQAAEKHKEYVKDVSDQVTATAKKTIQNSLHGAVKEFDKHSEILYERVKKVETGVSERVEKVETHVSERVEKLETDVSERLGKLETDFSSVEKRVTSLERTDGELDCIRQMSKKRLDYVKGKKEFNDGLVWGKTGIPNGLRKVRTFGCVSLETSGVMQCDDSVIRECPFSSYINPGEEMQYTTTLYKQYEIKLPDVNIQFCKQGDSGALVFVNDNTGGEPNIGCIGMLVGLTDDYSGYVTQITARLDKLKVKQFKQFTTHSTSSALLEQISGMFNTHFDRFNERFRQLEERISGIETAMNTNNKTVARNTSK